MADVIRVPVSFGEVLDKITILEIKSERIKDETKVKTYGLSWKSSARPGMRLLVTRLLILLSYASN